MPLSPRTTAAMMQQQTGDSDIVLITITHPSWTTPIYLSTHATTLLRTDADTGQPVFGTVSRGREYLYVPIQATMPTSQDEQPPEAHLIVSNVSRILSPYLKLVDKTPPRITLEVVNTNAPDVVDVAYPELDLQTVTWDANTVDAQVINNIASNEPMPWMRFNLSNFPNMQE